MKNAFQGLIRGFPPRLMTSVFNRTKTTARAATTRITKVIVVPVLVMGLVLSTVTPALGYRLLGAQWGFGKDSFTVCIRADEDYGFPSPTRRENIKSFINEWRGVADVNWAITLYGDASCFQPYDIIIRTADIGPPAQTDINAFAGMITHASVRLNRATVNNGRWHWPLSVEDSCFVGNIGSSGCHMDVKTVIMHEFGHALGIAHNTVDENYLCQPYGRPEAVDWACSPTGRKVMHWNAGTEFTDIPTAVNPHQGYRHYLTFDDKQALRAIYGDAP